MKKYLTAFAIAGFMLLAGCSTVTNLAGTTVSGKTVTVSVNAFDAVKATATNYVIYCTPNPEPAGCNDKVIRQMLAAVDAGTTARDSIVAYEKAHNNGPIGTSGVYDAMVSATSTIEAIVSQYNGAQ